MHHLHEDPVLWLQEFIFGMAQVSIATLLTGLWTLFTIHLPVPLRLKLLLNVTGVALLSIYTSTIFDTETHILGCISAAVSMSFTAPLQALSWVIRKSKKPISPVSNKEILLRIAIPAAVSSPRNPPERPRTQLIRGFIYLAIADVCRPIFFNNVYTPGWKRDLIGMCFVTFITVGALNIASSILGAFGIYSPSPFRRPWLSRNLREFWGHRWNAPVSDALRAAIYEPLLQNGWGKGAAGMACFVASGVAHELTLLYCGVKESRGEWFWFFVLCGVAAAVEHKIAKRFGRVGEYLFAVGSFFVLFHLLFLDVTVRSGIAVRGVQSVATFGVLAKAFATRVWGAILPVVSAPFWQ